VNTVGDKVVRHSRAYLYYRNGSRGTSGRLLLPENLA